MKRIENLQGIRRPSLPLTLKRIAYLDTLRSQMFSMHDAENISIPEQEADYEELAQQEGFQSYAELDLVLKEFYAWVQWKERVRLGYEDSQ